MGNVSKVCEICGVGFNVPEARSSTAKTCGRKCSGELAKKRNAEARVTMNCEMCGTQFSVPKCHAERSRCCSRNCAANLPDRKRVKGDEHYAWKGGRTEHSEGYLYVKTPSHPFKSTGDYVFEHRIVMESVMRQEAPDHPFLIQVEGEKYLKPEIEVHHINKNKKDNRPKNLLACTSEAHRSIHNGKAAMKGEAWPEQDDAVAFTPYNLACKCIKCGKMFEVKRSAAARGAGKFCDRSCYYSHIGKTKL